MISTDRETGIAKRPAIFKMPNRNPPGYIAPSRRKLKPLKVDLRPETLAAWKEAAARTGLSQRQAAEYMICTFARQQGVDAPEHPSPNGSKPPSLDC
jgi:hypothetical protein